MSPEMSSSVGTSRVGPSRFRSRLWRESDLYAAPPTDRANFSLDHSLITVCDSDRRPSTWDQRKLHDCRGFVGAEGGT